jgi:hypothetical protein
MDNQEVHIPLTAAEVSTLWNAYRSETLSNCLVTHFEQVAEDIEMRYMFEAAVQLFDSNISSLKDLFLAEEFPVPVGFTDSDVNLKAPALFTDETAIYLLKLLSEMGTQFYAQALKTTTRTDIRMFINESLSNYSKLTNDITDLLLTKGIYVKSPHIPTPESVDFVKDKSYLTGWLGERRPMHATQITHLYLNINRNYLGKTLLIGFAQTVKSEKIKKYLKGGISLADKMIDKFNLYLADIDMKSALPSGYGITTSTVAPFSDKLVLEVMLTINRYAVTFYSEALSVSTRRDLFKFYQNITTDTATYLNKSIDLSIEYGYFEEQPKAVDHQDIINKND